MKVVGFWRFAAAIVSYYVISAFLQIVTVSLIAFFHFLLDHKLGVIEDWVFDKGWEIVVCVKILSFFIVQKFIHLPSNSRQPFRDLILETWKPPSRKLFAICVASFLIILITAAPISNLGQSPNIFKTLVSYISSNVIILIDVVMLLSLRFYHGFSHWESRFAIVIMALLFWLANSALFPFATGFAVRDFFLHLVVLQLALWGRDNWSDPAMFVALVIAPTIALFGFDPIWGSKFSFFISSESQGIAAAMALWILTNMIFWWHSKTEQIA